MKCSTCPCEAGKPESPRLPKGWHRDREGKPVCAGCWGKRYVLRAITIPVAAPVSCDWPAFRDLLKTAWQRGTNLANLAVQVLLQHDVVRTSSMEKLPPMPPVNLYAECKERVGGYGGWSRSAGVLLQALERKYRSARYARIWRGETTLPNTRYPLPYPVPNADWKAAYGPDNVPLVTLTLPGQRVTLRLRGGRHFRRQLAAFSRIVSGEAVKGELALYRQRSNNSDHRNGTEGRDSGGQKVSYRYMCKMVAWLPRQEAAKGATGTLHVHTDKDSLLIALDAKDERVWVLNADHVRRWTAEHVRRLNRWSDDQKAEQRPVARYQSRREAAAEKCRRRLDSACHEASAQLANFARRRRFAAVRYDDSEKGFCHRFPWAKLKGLLAQKFDAAGIAFEGWGATSGERRSEENVEGEE